MCRWTKERTVTVSAFCFCGKRLDDVREDFCSEACGRDYEKQKDRFVAGYYETMRTNPQVSWEELAILIQNSLLPPRKEFPYNHSTT